MVVPRDRLKVGQVFLIDEVGKMECYSAAFVSAVRRLLGSSTPLVMTVGERGGGFIAEVRELSSAELWTVTRENRNALPRRVRHWLAAREISAQFC